MTGPKTHFIYKEKVSIEGLPPWPTITTVAPMHGSFVIVDKLVSTQCCSLALKKLQSKLQNRIKQLHALQVPKQIKFLIMRAIQWFQLYHAMATPLSHQSIEMMQNLDEIYKGCFVKLCPDVELSPYLRVLLHLPIEDGGIGLLPYEDMHQEIAQTIIKHAKSLCFEVGIGNEAPRSPPEYSIHFLWKHIASCRGWNNTPPFSYQCPLLDIDLASLSPEDRSLLLLLLLLLRRFCVLVCVVSFAQPAKASA